MRIPAGLVIIAIAIIGYGAGVYLYYFPDEIYETLTGVLSGAISTAIIIKLHNNKKGRRP